MVTNGCPLVCIVTKSDGIGNIDSLLLGGSMNSSPFRNSGPGTIYDMDLCSKYVHAEVDSSSNVFGSKVRFWAKSDNRPIKDDAMSVLVGNKCPTSLVKIKWCDICLSPAESRYFCINLLACFYFPALFGFRKYDEGLV